MNALGQYMRVHLAGAAAGIDLFHLSGGRITDAQTRREVKEMHAELVDERKRLVRMAEQVGASDPLVFSTITRLGAQATRLGPNGDFLHQTALTDLVVLETMRDAVAGKIAGWQALLTVVEQYDALDREELELLLKQGEDQHDRLTRAHRKAASKALAVDAESRDPAR